MKLHVLKIKESYLDDIVNGDKTFELRKNDRDYEVGDVIHFVNVDGNEFYFRDHNVYRITYVLKDVPKYGLDKDYCILGIKKLTYIDEIF